MDAFEVGARVERINSPADSLVKDGATGRVIEAMQCANGEMGYFVQFSVAAEPMAAAPLTFCAGSRLRPVNA